MITRVKPGSPSQVRKAVRAGEELPQVYEAKGVARARRMRGSWDLSVWVLTSLLAPSAPTSQTGSSETDTKSSFRAQNVKDEVPEGSELWHQQL